MMGVPLEAGALVGARYRLVEPVAAGGMAQVWRARDEVLGRFVAVKVLHPHLAGDDAFLVRFRREAVAAARLAHPGIVAIYDTVSERSDRSGPGLEAIVMELVTGTTLRRRFDDGGPLSSTETIGLGLAVADALGAAHRAGVVHRDIKPSNILLIPAEATDETTDAGPAALTVKVTDFGIAKAGEDTDLTVTGSLLGTAKYLSPEQVEGESADPRSDLYSLGIVLYEAVAGVVPFQADTDLATALARLHQSPTSVAVAVPGLAPELSAIIDRLLARRPDDRFDSAASLRLALLAAGRTAAAAPPSDGDETRSLDRTRTLAAGALGAAPAANGGPFAPPPADGPDAGGPVDVDVEDDSSDSVGQGWLLPALAVVLLGVGLVVAALLIGESSGVGQRFPGGEDGSGSNASDTVPLGGVVDVGPPEIASLASFDPGGDGSENDDRLDAAIDGNPDTAWPTETYRRAGFAGLKSGVGLVVGLLDLSEVSTLEVLSSSRGWQVEVYVGEGAGPGTEGSWGETVAVLDGAEPLVPVSASLQRPDAEGELRPPIGDWVLIWIRATGTVPPDDPGETASDDEAETEPGPLHRFELVELTLS